MEGRNYNWGMPFPRNISGLPTVHFLIATLAISLFVMITESLAISASSEKTSPQHPTLVASSSNISFGNIPQGQPKAQFETLTNTGDSTLAISQVKVTGPGFGVRDLSLPASLNAGQSVTFRVLCTPHAKGVMSGRIDVISSAAESNLAVTLSGAGVTGGSLNSSAGALNFGGVAVGTSKVLTVRLAAGASNVTIASATSTSPEFHLSELSLPMTIPAGQTASVSLIFTPQSSGATSGNISFAGDSADTLMVETLTGSGMAGSSHTVRLQWNPAPTKVKGYNVYRSSTPGGPYQKINPQVNSNPSFVDGSVQGGETYYYVSTAVSPDGKESKYSNQSHTTIPTP
jgi:hypothetical protein